MAGATMISLLNAVLVCFLLLLPSSSFLLHDRGLSLSNTHLRSSTTTTLHSTSTTSTTPRLHECQECSEKFQSRNALFRHIRDAHTDVPDIEVLSTTVIVRYGYIILDDIGDGSNSDTQNNELVANMIHESFQHCLSEFLQHQKCNPSEMMTTALTYSTAAKNRQPSLRQDAEVIGATSEVLSFNFKLGCTGTIIKRWREYASSGQLYDDMQAWLVEANKYNKICLHSLDALVPRSKKFFSERGCSQRSYRYMLPLRWILYDNAGEKLTNSELDEVQTWWSMIIARSSAELKRGHQQRGSSYVSPPDFIKRLKRALKAVESQTIPNRRLRRQKAYATEYDNASDTEENSLDDLTSTADLDTNDRAFRLSPGRFGQLWRKERRCWSNFCHPSLKGLESSPGHEAIWRTIDRSKIVGFINDIDDTNNTGKDFTHNMHAVIEFCGDGFVFGQIPRVLSSVIALTNGWLPSNFFDYTTRPDVYQPGPPMIPYVRGNLYFHTARFHFHELTGIGNDVIQFDPIIAGTDKEIQWEVNLRNKLLRDKQPIDIAFENEWLDELRVNCESMQTEMKLVSSDSNSDTNRPPDRILDTDQLSKLSPIPSESYKVVLSKLRDIASNAEWPATSGARSKVIKAAGSSGSSEKILTTKKGAVASVFPGVQSGSFTIVNEELLGIDSGIPIPHANSLFPELVKVVFELEKQIIDENEAPLPGAEGMHRTSPLVKRLPSTHCAVNRNAQFTPHVDSGRGQGQTLSMIVGLGDYIGGETLVEGVPYKIRYDPLEFNGWKQLHWTAPFQGERFSLVYFTPAMTLADDEEQASATSTLVGSSEDDRAAMLADANTKLLSCVLKNPLQFRTESTDALVIIELLDSESCAYQAEIQGFTLDNHDCALDIGAHIGVFSRLMLSKGCKHIICYEPEPSNFELLVQNLDTVGLEDASLQPIIELHAEAVAHGPSQTRKLVRARNQNDGTENTWRHSLEEYSQYVDKTTNLPSASQLKILERIDVTTIPFFGGALVPGVTLVKLDCEGAEIDILLSEEAARPSSWLDVTDFVVEWSFTKERRVSVFRKAVKNLMDAGFAVYYEGMGSWWDSDMSALWPYPSDLVIFAHRNKTTS
jgi:FkbM family methyltransferase